MENNFCPHCGKSTKEDKTRDQQIDELLAEFHADGDGKEIDQKGSSKKPNRMEK